MRDIELNIRNETSTLEIVVLGVADKNGPIPKIEDAYDPKSIEHILAGTYPKERDMIREMDAFEKALQKHGVEVLRPKVINNCNQIFTRDIAFVVDDKIILSNILPHREEELDAIHPILDLITSGSIIEPPEEVHVEGGDVMLWNDYVFVGTYYGSDYPNHITARTNPEAVDYLRDMFPNKEVVSFNLRKSNTDAKNNALHLDCCFQPIGKDKAIIHENGFLDKKELDFLIDYFGRDNIFFINADEMYHMWSNIFSISPELVVSEKSFLRLNTWMREHGIQVEEIPYSEVAKQEGLLRCSTLPLKRRDD